MGILDFVPIIGQVLDRIFPDPKEAADAKMRLAELAASGELAHLNAETSLMLAQIDVNKVEAASPSRWDSGWRPAFGWTCVFGCAWNWMLLPFLLFVCDLFGHPMAVGPADLTDMLPMLAGLLGFGYVRTKEKIAGVA